MKMNVTAVFKMFTIVSLFSFSLFMFPELVLAKSFKARSIATANENLYKVPIVIKSTQQKFTLIVKSSGRVQLVNTNSDVVYDGTAQQYYIPQVQNESAIKELHNRGLQLITSIAFNKTPQKKIKFGASANKEDVILFYEKGKITYIDTGFSQDPVEIKFGSTAKTESVQAIAVDLNHYIDTVSMRILKDSKMSEATLMWYHDMGHLTITDDGYQQDMSFQKIFGLDPKVDQKSLQNNDSNPIDQSQPQRKLSRMNQLNSSTLFDGNLDSPVQNHEQLIQRNRETNYVDYLNKMRTHLESEFMGQPEALEVLMNIVKEQITTGGLKKSPSVAMFIGLPGTGKDTAVEAYIKAHFFVKYGLNDIDINQHIFRYPVIKKQEDAATVTGSPPGYLGSENLSALIRFVVLHSGGKYYINPEDHTVRLNRSWREGQVLQGYFSPDDALLFANELHDWSKEQINEVLKETLEKGFFKIANPGADGGIDRMQVAIPIVLASNHGIGLIAARDQFGQRIGRPLTEQQLLERWSLNYYNKTALKDEISRPTASNPDGGLSEEVRSRIPDSNLVLLRPFSSLILKSVVGAKLKNIAAEFNGPKLYQFPSIDLEFTPRVTEFIVSYDYNSEDGARLLKSRIEQLITKTIGDAIFDEKIKLKSGEKLTVDVHSNTDGTTSLVLNGQNFLIQSTLKDQHKDSISDEKIDELGLLEKELNERVKGVEPIVKKLVRDIRRSHNVKIEKDVEYNDKMADLYMFLGSSSTGKTELAVALHQLLYKTQTKPLIIDFGQIQTIESLQEKILGSRDHLNRPVMSDFMQNFDRANGDLVIVFDEISNARPELLKALYDVLREPVVKTFSDDNPRSMAKVKIIMTGNAGEEWYNKIPRNLPEYQQLKAARSIYHEFMNNAGARRSTLLRYFTEAFLNRVGEERIYFFAPHTYKVTRELIQSLLIKSLRKFIKPEPGVRTWNVVFNSVDDYKKTIETIEQYGFRIWEQGASIKRFINDTLLTEIHDRLLTAKIASGETVRIVHKSNIPAADRSRLNFELVVGDRRVVLPLVLEGHGVMSQLKQNSDEVLLTAYHEAGHEITRHVLFQNYKKSGGVSIKPGVTLIGDEAIVYNGIATSFDEKSQPVTRDYIIDQIAVLMAGEQSEKLTTQNAIHTSGISNDLMRATEWAQMAILKFGFSNQFKSGALPEGTDTETYLMSLSNKKKAVVEKEVEIFLSAGRQRAREVIIANFDTLFIPVAQMLVQKGELSGNELERFYKQHSSDIIHPLQRERVHYFENLYSQKTQKAKPNQSVYGLQFWSFLPRTQKIIDIDKLIKKDNDRERAQVDLSPGLALVDLPTNQKLSSQSNTNNKTLMLEKSLNNNGVRALKCEALF